MEEYSGVFTWHLTDRQPSTSTPQKHGSELAENPQIGFSLGKIWKVEGKTGGALSNIFRATFLVAQLDFVCF